MEMKYIDVHHTGGTGLNPIASTQHQKAEDVDAWHKKKWNFESALDKYGGYNFFIDKTGKLTQFRQIGEETAHTRGHNRDTIGICLAGNFTKGSPDTPTEEQEYRLGEVIYNIIKGNLDQYSVADNTIFDLAESRIVPHRALSNTSCHGNKLSDAFGREMYRKYKEVAENKEIDPIQEIYNLLLDVYAKIVILLKKRGLSSTRDRGDEEEFIN